MPARDYAPRWRAARPTRRQEVRIHDGACVLRRPGCVPRMSFHPKGFSFSGDEARLLISGSANLAENGFKRGAELDTVLEIRSLISRRETPLRDELGELQEWFDEQIGCGQPLSRRLEVSV
jgi:hypothetical protein